MKRIGLLFIMHYKVVSFHCLKCVLLKYINYETCHDCMHSKVKNNEREFNDKTHQLITTHYWVKSEKILLKLNRLFKLTRSGCSWRSCCFSSSCNGGCWCKYKLHYENMSCSVFVYFLPDALNVHINWFTSFVFIYKKSKCICRYAMATTVQSLFYTCRMLMYFEYE